MKILSFADRFDYHMKEVLNGAVTAFVLKMIAAGLLFVFNVVLSRMLGAERAGMYFLSVTVVTFAATVGRVGLDNALVRFIASHAAFHNWAAVKGLYIKGIKIVVAASCIVSVLLLVSAHWLAVSVFSKPDLENLLRMMSLAVVPVALFTLFSNLLKGLKRIADSMTVLSILLPAFSLVGIAVTVPLWQTFGAVGSYVVAAVLTMFIGFIRWHRATPQLREVAGEFATAPLLQSSIPMFWVALLQYAITWSPLILLGIWSSATEVALFSIANNIATSMSLILIAVNSISAPKFAVLYGQGDTKTLEKVAQDSTLIVTLLVCPLFVIFLLAPGPLMGLFGPQFVFGAHLLMILSVGQFINVATGSVGLLLVMTGYEVVWQNITAVAVAIQLLLNLLLVPGYGAMGAAVATAVAVSLQMLSATVLVRKKLGITTIPVARLRVYVQKNIGRSK